jgi:DNA-binding NtrC family response regulator
MREYPGRLAPVSGNPLAKPMLSNTSPRSSGRRILLVENEEGQRQLYKEGLCEEGYLVSCATNGRKALKHLEALPCDLIVLDIEMPEMDGIEVLPKIVSRYKKMPVILHTAYAQYQNDFMTRLADAFVVKSADLSALKQTVKKLLEKNSEEKDGRGECPHKK